jgi:restriction system protein
LLTRLRSSDPGFFEEAVVKVLLAMGYGGTEQRGKRIGGTGDGGVDGVIDQDALGLDQIYVQAKRYADGNTIGRETIQAFIGALQGFGATRGVFITSSTFTANARDYANAISTRVILIDGQRLAQLMIKYRVGVQVKQSYEVVEIDEDFFE